MQILIRMVMKSDSQISFTWFFFRECNCLETWNLTKICTIKRLTSLTVHTLEEILSQWWKFRQINSFSISKIVTFTKLKKQCWKSRNLLSLEKCFVKTVYSLINIHLDFTLFLRKKVTVNFHKFHTLNYEFTKIIFRQISCKIT